MVRHRTSPSRTWRTFLAKSVHDLASVDLFTVPTVTFRVLFVFIMLAREPANPSLELMDARTKDTHGSELRLARNGRRRDASRPAPGGKARGSRLR